MLNRIAFSLLVLSMPLTSLAQTHARVDDYGYGRLSYTLGEARVIARDPDGAGEADGVSLGGSALLTPDVFVAGSLASVGSNDYDEDTFELGVGLRHGLTSQMDLLGVAGLVHSDRQLGNRDLGGDFRPSLTGGIRSMLTPAIEVGAYAKYTRLYSDSDLGLRGEGLYHFTPNFSALASVGLTNNERNAALGVRWYFQRRY